VVEREISLEDAKAEQEAGQTPAQPAAEKPQEDLLDIIQPKSEPKTWKIASQGFEREYVQRELSFIGKMQWFSLVGEVLEKAMSGDNALSLNNLLTTPEARGQSLTMQDFRDADTFVQAVGKLLVYAPDFLEKSFCIWLGVPDYEQEVVKQIMASPTTEGGLSDDQGLEIIEIFIDQNYGAIEGFFREKVAALQKRVQARQKDRASRSTRP
jgi:hypothetical protein